MWLVIIKDVQAVLQTVGWKLARGTEAKAQNWDKTICFSENDCLL